MSFFIYIIIIFWGKETIPLHVPNFLSPKNFPQLETDKFNKVSTHIFRFYFEFFILRKDRKFI